MNIHPDGFLSNVTDGLTNRKIE